MLDFIENTWYRIKLLYSWWVNVFLFDWDWDFHYTRVILKFKLERVYKHFTTCKIHKHKKVELRALKECIDILGRLIKNDYEEPYEQLHNAKWGESKHEFTPTEDGKYTQMVFSRPNANTEEEKKQEREEYLKYLNQATKDKEADRKRLYFLLHKYEETWWC